MKLISKGLDGELDGKERRQLQELLASDPAMRKTAQDWEKAGDELRRSTGDVPVPDSLLAWHDIRRAIRENESNTPAKLGPASLLRLKWAGGIAAFLVVGMLALSFLHLTREGRFLALDSLPPPRVEWVVAEIPGATTMIYTDMETDLTVIWMDVAQNVDPRDT